MIPVARLVESERGVLAVREWGDGDGVPFVFWHALSQCASGGELVELAPRLAAAGYAPLSFDGPGFGASPLAEPDAYRLNDLAELARSTIAGLGLGRPVLMGHSWGGGVMTTLAGMYPTETRALVLLDSGHIDYAELDVTGTEPITWEWESRAVFRAWLHENLGRATPEVIEGYETGVHDVDGKVVGSSAEAARRARAGLLDLLSPLWPRLEHVPVLLFLATEPPHGGQNHEHIDRFTAAVPHAEVRWVDGATHGLIADIGPPLGDEIAAWLDAQR